MAAGLGFKTFTTGEVLTAADTNGYLMQGVLVFASAAARDAAITSPQEGQCCYLKDTDAVLTYSGSAWVGFDDSNAIQNSIVDAKGDIVAASAADTPARLAVGSNGETLVADSSTSTGLRYQAPIQQNPVINSAMQVWQRGTSIAPVSATDYTADRWTGYFPTGTTVSRQVTGDTTNLPFIQYCARIQRNSGQTSTTVRQFTQSLETINSVQFAGKTITLSFYARAGANFSSASNLLNARAIWGTGTDQNYTGTYTGATLAVNQDATLTTTWQRFSYTGSIGATATEVAMQFQYTPSGTAGTNDYFEITGVQWEVGSVATPFHTYAATIQGELAACQRYYQKSYAQGTAPATNSQTPGLNFAQGSTVVNAAYLGGVKFPVVMRSAPTVTIYSFTSSTTGVVSTATGTDQAAGSGGTVLIGDTGYAINQASGGTITAGNGGFIWHHQLSAEL
jgi:hypothetical protein